MESKLKQTKSAIILLGLTVLYAFSTNAQYCDSITPSFTVDLSSSPNQTWVSPLTDRDGNCCGTSMPDKCLEFIITLSADAIAVNFNIASGAVPPGALFYQIDCGPVIAVGQPICLSGAGPHHLTFCKPGNNTNTFSITSYSEPIIGPDITLNAGCTGMIHANYYNEPSMTWTSIAPGPVGAYDSYLACTSGCDSVNVTATGTPPAFVDYLVCGSDIAGCNPLPYCDTIRVTFIPPVTVSVSPDVDHICFGEGPVLLTTTVTGGTGPYFYLWSNGQTSSSISVFGGTYFVDVMDITGCIIASDTATITQDMLPILADAGPDQTFCNQSTPLVSLNGTIQTATGGAWEGGSGIFAPNNTTLNATYSPTPAELSAGFVDLSLVSTGNNGCPADTDEVRLNLLGFDENIILATTDITCFGLANGQASISVTGFYSPCTFSWDGGPITTLTSAINLTPGNHTVQIFNTLGCDTLITYSISEPALLMGSLISQQDNVCFGEDNGNAQVTANGGTGTYSYSWNTSPVQNTSLATGLSAGTYTCTITDENSCSDLVDVTITEPTLLNVSLSGVEPNCFGSSNGSIASLVAGGTAPYQYDWSTSATSSNLYDLESGTYSVIVEDDNGCLAYDTLLLNQPTQIVGEISPSSIICPDASTEIGVLASGGTGNYQYEWLPNGETTDTIIVSPTNDMFYNCIITDNNGCSIMLSTSVNINVLNPNDLMATINDGSICLNDSVGISAQYIGPDVSVQLSWQHCPTCPTNGTLYEFPTSNTEYIIEAVNYCGQVITDTVSVIVNDLPEIALDPNMGTICPNGSVTFYNQGDNNVNWTYYWNYGDGNSGGSMNPTHVYSAPGTYSIGLTVIDNNGCTSSVADNSFVVVNPNAHASFNTSSSEVTTLDPTFECINLSSNAVYYTWNFGDGTTSNLTNPEHTYADYGMFSISLVANNQFNCPDSTFITVEVKPSFDLYVPNAFTPDGDDHNQYFLTQGYGISEKDFTLYVFNRWGDLIFESHDMTVGWDGTCKNDGTKAQDDVYTWVVIFRDLTDKKHRKEGHVCLLK